MTCCLRLPGASVIEWQRDKSFTIKFDAQTEEQRNILLDAMRDRMKMEVTIEWEEEQ